VIVTLCGPNDFARKQELEKIVATFLRDHDAMAVERLDGEDTTAERMQEAASSLPFLTARKLVLLHEPGKQKTWAETIADILPKVAETTDLVIAEPKLDKRLSYYKILKKSTDFREFGELDANGLARWAGKYAKEKGGSLGLADATLLVNRLGTDQLLLQHELDKLLVYNPHISKQTIELLVDPLPQSTVFELLDAAFRGNTKRMLELYHEQRAQKVEPQAILALIAWQLHVLAVIKTAGARSTDDIAKTAKLNPFVVRKSVDISKRLSLEKLKRMVADVLALDLRLKSVSIDADESLQLYLLRLSSGQM